METTTTEPIFNNYWKETVEDTVYATGKSTFSKLSELSQWNVQYWQDFKFLNGQLFQLFIKTIAKEF